MNNEKILFFIFIDNDVIRTSSIRLFNKWTSYKVYRQETRNCSKECGIDFIPLITEQYDLVILKKPANERLIRIVTEILSSNQFQSEVDSLGDYDTSRTGKIIYETN